MQQRLAHSLRRQKVFLLVCCVWALCAPQVSAVSRTWAQKHAAAKQTEHELVTDQISDNWFNDPFQLAGQIFACDPIVVTPSKVSWLAIDPACDKWLPQPHRKGSNCNSWLSYLPCASQKAFSQIVYLQDGDSLSYYLPFLLPQFPVALNSLLSLVFLFFFSLLGHRLPSFFSIFCLFSTIIRGFPHCSHPLPSLPFLFSLLSFFCLALSAHQSSYDSREQLTVKKASWVVSW